MEEEEKDTASLSRKHLPWKSPKKTFLEREEEWERGKPPLLLRGRRARKRRRAFRPLSPPSRRRSAAAATVERGGERGRRADGGGNSQSGGGRPLWRDPLLHDQEKGRRQGLMAKRRRRNMRFLLPLAFGNSGLKIISKSLFPSQVGILEAPNALILSNL